MGMSGLCADAWGISRGAQRRTLVRRAKGFHWRLKRSELRIPFEWRLTCKATDKNVCPTLRNKREADRVSLGRKRDCGEGGIEAADDEFLAGRAVWVAGFVEEPGIHGDCGVDAGVGDWREYGVVFGGERCFVESTAVSEPGPASGCVCEDC